MSTAIGASMASTYLFWLAVLGRIVRPLDVELGRRAGELLGRAETTLGSDGTPLKARLTVPSGPARLDLTFLSTARDSFAPEIWLPRKP